MKKEETTQPVNKILETTVEKGKKGTFILRTVNEIYEVVENLKELKAISDVYEKSIVIMEERCEKLQKAINKISSDEELKDTLSIIISELDAQRTELEKGKENHKRIKQVIELCKNAK